MIFIADITNWCVGSFETRFEHDVYWCWEWKFLVTDYVRWNPIDRNEALIKLTSNPLSSWRTWIQVNKIEWGKTVWMFQDEDTINWYAEWNSNKVTIWMYLLVYESKNSEDSWFAWQVRMVTWISDDKRSLELNAPWLWFKVPEDWEDKVEWRWLKYKFFPDWWEVVGFTDWKEIDLILDYENSEKLPIYKQEWTTSSAATRIIWMANANDKVFVLTDNWYIHYSKTGIWHDKFFFDDDMYAGVDKINLTAFRDMIVAFGRKHIALWVPDEQNVYWTMYNQSTSIWLWSRYSYNEYNWGLVFVSNDKRLMALVVNSAGRYGLSFDDIWERLNGKLSTLVEWDEVYIWSDNNNLKVFVNTKEVPFVVRGDNVKINDVNNTETHIYKYDTLFQVWTEDHIPHFLLWWMKFWIYFWEYWLYIRWRETDIDKYEDISAKYWWSTAKKYPVETKINAYLIENEGNWTWQANSRLASRPKLYNLAKLNRLITTLWPGIYSNNVKIRITNYSKWIWYTYEFPVDGDWNERIWLMTSYYLDENLDAEQEEKIECALSTLQDWQVKYQPNCPDSKMLRQYMRPDKPWCDSYEELLTETHWVCINDKLYELAPTMPLVTNLWENQPYSTQIKLELIWWQGDVICFGWWLAEMFIAPLFMTWPDWEYQLQPETDCN